MVWIFFSSEIFLISFQKKICSSAPRLYGLYVAKEDKGVMSSPKDTDHKERTCSLLAAGGGGWRRKEQGDNLGGRDSKQLYHFGRKFKLEAKLLLSQLLCLRMSSGRLIVSHSSRLHFTNPLPSHSLGSTNSRSPSLTLGR